MFTNPYPVPSECVDITPPLMWDTLWQAGPKGTIELPAEITAGCGPRIPLWKNHWFKLHKDDKKTHAPPVVARKYWSVFPQGHTEPTVFEARPKSEWDDQKHGYWNVGGRLQYRSADGKVHLGVDGADRW